MKTNKLKAWSVIGGVGALALLLSGCSRQYSSPGFYGHLAIPGRFLMAKIAPYVGGYGIAIVLFTVIVRLCLMPLLLDQSKSMTIRGAIMQHIQPQVDKFKHEIKNATDKKTKQKYMEQMSALLKKNGLGLAGSGVGCLEMLVQLPIYAALYAAIRTSPQISRASFLGVNLGKPSIIFVAIATILYFINARITVKHMKASAAKQPKGKKNNKTKSMHKVEKSFSYFAPVSIGLISLASPAGVTIYFCVGGFFIIAQQMYIHYRQPKLEAIAKKRAAQAKTK